MRERCEFETNTRDMDEANHLCYETDLLSRKIYNASVTNSINGVQRAGICLLYFRGI